MTNSIKFEIISELEMDHKWLSGEALIPLGGCSDDGSQLGLGSWQYQFVVDVTVNGETRRFTVDFQPLERSDRMRNYFGYFVTTAAKYGCDSDESPELLNFCDHNELVLDQLHEIADAAAKAEFELLLEEAAEERIAKLQRKPL